MDSANPVVGASLVWNGTDHSYTVLYCTVGSHDVGFWHRDAVGHAVSSIDQQDQMTKIEQHAMG